MKRRFFFYWSSINWGFRYQPYSDDQQWITHIGHLGFGMSNVHEGDKLDWKGMKVS